jgi:hypothetical protein
MSVFHRQAIQFATQLQLGRRASVPNRTVSFADSNDEERRRDNGENADPFVEDEQRAQGPDEN